MLLITAESIDFKSSLGKNAVLTLADYAARSVR